MDLNTFWTQPAKGFTEETRGRTEQEIQAEEVNRGFKFPHTYRELMKLQNGGYTRRTSFFIDGEQRDMSAQMDKIPAIYYKNMREWLEEGESEEEIQAHSKTGFCYPERLVFVSGLHGHEFMCLDYGWDQQESKAEPELCFMHQEFKEYARFPSFDAFVEKLVYYGTRCETFQFGLNSELPIEKLADKFSDFLGTRLEEKTDSYYGWWNFEKYYYSNVKVDEHISLLIYLSPNRFVSGTYLVQSKPDIRYIVRIKPMDGKIDHLPDSPKYLRIIKNYLSGFELLDSMEELFFPEDVKHLIDG